MYTHCEDTWIPEARNKQRAGRITEPPSLAAGPAAGRVCPSEIKGGSNLTTSGIQLGKGMASVKNRSENNIEGRFKDWSD